MIEIPPLLWDLVKPLLNEIEENAIYEVFTDSSFQFINESLKEDLEGHCIILDEILNQKSELIENAECQTISSEINHMLHKLKTSSFEDCKFLDSRFEAAFTFLGANQINKAPIHTLFESGDNYTQLQRDFIETNSDLLNVFDIDDVATKIEKLLEKEQDAFTSYIANVLKRIDLETEILPSLDALREMRDKVRKQVELTALTQNGQMNRKIRRRGHLASLPISKTAVLPPTSRDIIPNRPTFNLPPTLPPSKKSQFPPKLSTQRLRPSTAYSSSSTQYRQPSQNRIRGNPLTSQLAELTIDSPTKRHSSLPSLNALKPLPDIPTMKKPTEVNAPSFEDYNDTNDNCADEMQRPKSDLAMHQRPGTPRFDPFAEFSSPPPRNSRPMTAY
eukprot:TRINITY_DN13851_c0_g1_i1.p1 TRINITY_DN13851_c0_g1~~TRINITY_DN13851_c0_g1_i1.p1  ORF type:complete len:389 (-),score=77.89 TRINITY_DN13851_c0_g1_i1:118-1284(-)